VSSKISFGIIVLNGEPFTRYCIHALYPYAYEIIIAEGACEGARNIATEKGHSKDGTLEILREIKRLEDPENKITIITSEDEGHPDGFWPGEKLEQSQAYAKRAKGDYLWQVDIDEFYKDEDIRKIIILLNEDDKISCISFNQIGFWGGFNYTVDSWYFKRYLPEIFRVFKWVQGYQYVSHRPPTVINKEGINLKEINFLDARQTKKMRLFMYHYSFVFPKQVREKALYYKNADWSRRKEAEWWANDVFTNLSHPYRVFSISWIPSWLVSYKNTQPKEIDHLINDINRGFIKVELRKTHDIEVLVNSPKYKLGIALLKMLEPLEMFYQIFKKKSKLVLKKILFKK